jgi:outer membrane receptor protein involved in Fe transport
VPQAPEPIPLARAPDSRNIVSFGPKDFVAFQPTSALDMIQRLPGFTFDKGASDVRGFNGTAGNVLIDGERPSSKSVPLEDVLRRIAVSAVVRIDLIRGGAPGIDMQGKTVVANIVRGSNSSSSLAGELWTKLYTDHEPARIMRLEGTRQRGPLSLEGSLHLRQEKEQNQSGRGDFVRRGPSGAALAEGDFESAWDRSFGQGSLAAQYDFGSTVLRTSAGALYEAQDRRDTATLTNPAGLRFAEEILADYETYQLEGGLDLKHDFASGTSGRILALRTRIGDTLRSTSTSLAPSQRSDERNVKDETIVRATLNKQFSPALSVEVGAEGALNSLDAKTQLQRGGVPVPLPSDVIVVEETRGEAFGTVRMKPVRAMSLEIGLRYEISTISQEGDANQSRTLQFWKPRLLATYDLTPATQARVRVERTVGQLNFKDFAATAAIDSGSANAGNPNLRPESGWIYEGSLEQRFWGEAVFVAGFSRANVRDVVDLIPINGIDAPGNLGSGRREELKMSLSSPLARLGLPGMNFRVNLTRRWSEVLDPVTNRTRPISRVRDVEGDVLLTKSLPALKSVVSFDTTLGFSETQYRLREVRTDSDAAPFKFYWDYTPRRDLTFRFQLENFSSKTRRRERILFNGPRSANQVASIERRSATLPPFLMLRARKTF